MLKLKSILLLLFIVINIFANDGLDELFQEAIQSFENKDYESSLDIFLSIENEGIKNPDLYYNIGNCFFRLNNIGSSILYYKRALKIDQNHSAAARNLEFVLTFTQDKQVEDESDPISTLWNKLLNALSLNTLAIIVLIVFLISIFLLILMFTRFRNRDKTSLIFTFSISIIIILLFCIISFIKWEHYTGETEAVLLSKSTIGFSGPGEEFTRVFTIHEGMIFHIEKTENNWSLIKLPNGIGGWIQITNYQLI